MNLLEKINDDLKSAMKTKDQFRLGVLRMVNSALQNEKIKKGKDSVLDEEEILKILAKEAKKRKESVSAFENGGRLELAEKEKKELAIIEEYLPEQMSREEVVILVGNVLNNISDKSSFGLVMKEVMKELKGSGRAGKADAKIISEIVKEKLG
ncbi:GatB/YqeY domain-containing protein [Patescibacteria group bacterium]|nr:GatB/YqeY domain-containing protein [Patescibacteria group bacterium]